MIVALTLVVVASAAWLFQDTIGLWLINPDRSYEAYTPPPAPDYQRAGTWLARGQGEGPVDVFFIHNNVYRGDGRWNAPHDRQTQLPFLRDVLVPLEAGPFASLGPLWAPRYREPTFFARFTQKQPGVAARDTAYRDIAAAFDTFLAQRESERPFVLVGYGDGALFAGRLFERRIARRPDLQQHLVAAYAIDLPLPRPLFAPWACNGEGQSRCIVAFTSVDRRFTSYQERLRKRTLTLRAGTGYVSTSTAPLLCAPPPIPKQALVMAAGRGAPVSADLSAACEDGLLLFGPLTDRSLRQPRFFGRQWFPDAVNPFHGVLKDDAEARVLGLVSLLATEAAAAMVDEEEDAPPAFGPAEDIAPAPILRVPPLAEGPSDQGRQP